MQKLTRVGIYCVNISDGEKVSGLKNERNLLIKKYNAAIKESWTYTF